MRDYPRGSIVYSPRHAPRDSIYSVTPAPVYSRGSIVMPPPSHFRVSLAHILPPFHPPPPGARPHSFTPHAPSSLRSQPSVVRTREGDAPLSQPAVVSQHPAGPRYQSHFRVSLLPVRRPPFEPNADLPHLPMQADFRQIAAPALTTRTKVSRAKNLISNSQLATQQTRKEKQKRYAVQRPPSSYRVSLREGLEEGDKPEIISSLPPLFTPPRGLARNGNSLAGPFQPVSFSPRAVSSYRESLFPVPPPSPFSTYRESLWFFRPSQASTYRESLRVNRPDALPPSPQGGALDAGLGPPIHWIQQTPSSGPPSSYRQSLRVPLPPPPAVPSSNKRGGGNPHPPRFPLANPQPPPLSTYRESLRVNMPPWSPVYKETSNSATPLPSPTRGPPSTYRESPWAGREAIPSVTPHKGASTDRPSSQQSNIKTSDQPLQKKEDVAAATAAAVLRTPSKPAEAVQSPIPAEDRQVTPSDLRPASGKSSKAKGTPRVETAIPHVNVELTAELRRLVGVFKSQNSRRPS
uniref:Uncharacterized protein n=1 Tax=Chromera velia CCMP2878 TaxID=1169474 RepID=A0A0G4HTM3_9ALVE|eukprot:Cvel_1358.t1-p1 / transcript=Cvel_1358.t1 / gene=Cvel_1358 / organism=Chromera_velia_CCMP2878 / gene_product=hypothetical protein / transcript_product=hypothetical protein / location=Cvel_scaffold46:152182-153738(-) / protein_length=519 / sequence_SO=supercontig / SO=protein_coding / is_pseudo=false